MCTSWMRSEVSARGTTIGTSTSARALPPPLPSRPTVAMPFFFAASIAARMFGLEPEVEIATSRSPLLP